MDGCSAHAEDEAYRDGEDWGARECGVSQRDVEQAAKKDWRRINLAGHEQRLSAGEKIAQETAAPIICNS